METLIPIGWFKNLFSSSEQVEDIQDDKVWGELYAAIEYNPSQEQANQVYPKDYVKILLNVSIKVEI